MITLGMRRGRLPRWYFVTSPTSYYKRFTGEETWPDPVTFSGGIVGAIPALSTVSIAAGTTTLTLSPANHAGKSCLIQSTGGLAVTPPAATGTLNVYTFIFVATITGGSFTFDAKAGNASDIIEGIIDTNKVGTGLTQYGTAANTNLFTLNGTTTGGIKGDFFQLIDIATNFWIIRGTGQQSGTVATPFSNH